MAGGKYEQDWLIASSVIATMHNLVYRTHGVDITLHPDDVNPTVKKCAATVYQLNEEQTERILKSVFIDNVDKLKA